MSAHAEKPDLYMVRRGGAMLAPVSLYDADQVAALPRDKNLRVKVTRARSVPQHRLYWAMLRLVCDNLDTEVSDKALHEWVKLKCGVSAPIPLRNGRVDLVPGSIAFDEMDQGEFQAFFDKAKALIVEHIIPGLDSDALEREARLMLGEAA